MKESLDTRFTECLTGHLDPSVESNLDSSRAPDVHRRVSLECETVLVKPNVRGAVHEVTSQPINVV